MKKPTPIHEWPSANQGFFRKFIAWLEQGGYGASARKLYGCAARIALGWLDTPYWMIALPGDVDRVREYIAERYESEATIAQLSPKTRSRLDALLNIDRVTGDPDKVALETTKGYSDLYELKRGPGAVKLDSLLTEIVKLETIEALELPADLFAGVSSRILGCQD